MEAVRLEKPEGLDLVNQWFRALDQRLIYVGLREWRVQVTGVYVDADDVWIQIADGSHGGSVVLRVRPTTPVDHAVRLLTAQCASRPYPQVVSAVASPVGSELRHVSTAN